MSETDIDKMKKIIEEKKKKSSEQSSFNSTPSKMNSGSNKGFKNTKRSGSLNK